MGNSGDFFGISQLDQVDLLGTLVASLYVYKNIPGGVGVDLEPSLGTGLRAFLGAALGVTVGLFFHDLSIYKEVGKVLESGWPWNVWLKYYDGSQDVNSFRAWKTASKCAMIATISELLVPDNKGLQAAAVAIIPARALWNVW